MTLDALDAKSNDAFPGRVVRKDLVRRVKVGANVSFGLRIHFAQGFKGVLTRAGLCATPVILTTVGLVDLNEPTG